MARKMGISFLVLMVVFCIGLSVIAVAGAVVIVQSSSAIPFLVTPTPQGSFLFEVMC
jgi:hypothetical protein